MAKVKLHYYVIRHGRGYFAPTPRMIEAGFQPRPLGADGPKAWVEAQRLYEDWLRIKSGRLPIAQVEQRPEWPQGSIGHAFERYRRTDAWAAKAPSTRKKDWDWSWKFIEPVFGDVNPRTVQIEDIEQFRSIILRGHGLHTAHRVIKIWRALWKVMAAMKLCKLAADPSMIIRNTAPAGRDKTWAPGEIARIAKRSWREGYRGLAALLAISWDTQFSAVDCRNLTPAHQRRDRTGLYFVSTRQKSGVDVIGTLSRRGEKVLGAYLKALGVTIAADAQLFRNRSGHAYSADTLGDDFRLMREMTFPGDTRQLIDIRRTGAVEAVAGDASAEAMAAKMGNSIDQNRHLAQVYLPARTATVRKVDEARRRGRKAIRETES